MAGEGYGTPAAFFGITFLTEGLKRVLTTTLQRLAGVGGDPVIGLQTAFGGGKTHTMLAIYHLAKHLRDCGDLRGLSGLHPCWSGWAGSLCAKPKIAVFVGSSKGTDVSLTLKEAHRFERCGVISRGGWPARQGLKLVAECGSRAHQSRFGTDGRGV